MSFKESVNLCELPVVTFFQGDKKFNFLLDTGSNNCVIDKKVLRKIDHKMTDIHGTLFGMEGNTSNTGVCLITLTFNKKDYTYGYLIKDMGRSFNLIKKETGVTLHGVLGAGFFNEFKYILDFDKLIAYSKK